MSSEGKGHGRATPWPLGGRLAGVWHWPDAWTRFSDKAGARLRDWFAADVAPGRLVPWLPVAFGAGIAVYFAAETEPSVWAVSILTLIGAIAVILLRRRALAFPLALAFTAAACGLAIATWRAAVIEHPVLPFPATLKVSGWVEMREERERSDRIVIRTHHVEAGRIAEVPQRVRVAVRRGTAPAVGSFVELQARLSPPLQPLRPGGYDFARDLYFQKVA